MASISNPWLRGVNEQDKAHLKESILAAALPLNRLKDILHELLEVSRKTSTKDSNYELPSWSNYQADKLGEQRTLLKIIKLLELDQARK